MRFTTLLGVAAVTLSIPAMAAAQATSSGGYSSSQPSSSSTSPSGSATSPSSSSSTAPSSATSGATTGAAVTAGLPVKDKTGMQIGQVTDVKADASGKQVATIKMGADTFAVDTSALAVDKGAATINATQAELKAMLPKK